MKQKYTPTPPKSGSRINQIAQVIYNIETTCKIDKEIQYIYIATENLRTFTI